MTGMCLPHHGSIVEDRASCRKAYRAISLFPELRPYLEKAFEMAPDGAEFVVDARFRKGALGPAGWLDSNLRTTCLKIIRRAGLQPWPRVFQNLRASRETELVETYPVGWLGNTSKVAMQHYLMTTDEHIDAAVRGAEKRVAGRGAVHFGNGGKRAASRSVRKRKRPSL